ncbi:MAG: thymidylate kinase [Ruminococcaceae bacterium]|nr:thymidylate kinase [Oscillospiraceae bacterium]
MPKLIAIEGLDGSGKGTQSALLCKSVEMAGRTPVSVSFPDYDSPGAVPVKMYLGGELGASPGDTGAYAASMLFATDRYISYKTKWEKDALAEGAVVVANRYTTANAYHQMAKLPEDMWDTYLTWLWDLEFTKLALPAPDGVIMLSLPTEVSASLIEKRCVATGVTKDIHECDMDYLAACRKAALYVAEKLGWTVISCEDGNGGILPIDVIHEKVCRVASDILGFEIPV